VRQAKEHAEAKRRAKSRGSLDKLKEMVKREDKGPEGDWGVNNIICWN